MFLKLKILKLLEVQYIFQDQFHLNSYLGIGLRIVGQGPRSLISSAVEVNFQGC
jgi:hypothetical protein